MDEAGRAKVILDAPIEQIADLLNRHSGLETPLVDLGVGLVTVAHEGGSGQVVELGRAERIHKLPWHRYAKGDTAVDDLG